MSLVEMVQNGSKFSKKGGIEKFYFWKNCRKIPKKFRDIDFDALISKIYLVC